MVEFSSGDLIALGVGSVSVIRWIAEKYFSNEASDSAKFSALQLDWERFKAARAEIDRANGETLRRLEASINALQSQIRLLVIHGNDKFFEARRGDDEAIK